MTALARRPAAVAETAAVAAWVLVVAHTVAILAGVHRHDTRSGYDTMVAWVVMSAAMMLPSALPAARHVAVESLCRRRHRAVAEYVIAYVAVWVVVGAVATALLAVRPVPLPVALLVAAAWQASPWHAAYVRDCHRTVPLPVSGRRAEVAALRFGARNGRACVGSCWALMLVMAVVPGAHLAWTLALGGIVTAEKLLPRPRRTARLAAVALIAAALVSVAPATAAFAPGLLTLPVVAAVVVTRPAYALSFARP